MKAFAHRDRTGKPKRTGRKFCKECGRYRVFVRPKPMIPNVCNKRVHCIICERAGYFKTGVCVRPEDVKIPTFCRCFREDNDTSIWYQRRKLDEFIDS